MSVQYILHVCLPNEEEQRVDIESKLVVGSDEGCDVSYPAAGIDKQHLTFRVNNEVLTVKNHSATEPLLGQTAIKRRKMVIIDEGDVITLGDLTLKVSKNDDDQGVDMSKEDELPSATTLFKLAKAELDALDDEECSTEQVPAVSSEDKTGEVDVQAMVEEDEGDDDYSAASEELEEDLEEEEPRPPKKGFFSSILNIFKRKKKNIDDEQEDDTDLEELGFATIPDSSHSPDENDSDDDDSEHEFKLSDDDDEELDEEEDEDLLPEEDDSEVEFEEPIDNPVEEEDETPPEEKIPQIPSRNSVQEQDKIPNDVKKVPIKNAIKKPSLFKRLQMKMSKKSSSTTEENIKKIPPLGIMARLYALTFNYLTAYMIYAYLGSYVQEVINHPIIKEIIKEPIIQKAVNFVLTYWVIIPDEYRLYLVKLFPIYLLVVAQDIFFSLILGMPLPLLALGVKSKGSFIFKRISNTIKSLLHLFHPLLILDLPLLLSLPSFKEMISFSRYYKTESKIYTYIGHYLILPLMFIITLSTSIFMLDSFSETGIPKGVKQTIIQRPVAVTSNYKSKNYGFAMNGVDSNLLLVPVNYNNFDNSYYVKLISNKESLTFKIQSFPHFNQLVEYLRVHNPIIKFFYPAPIEPSQLEKLISTTFDLALNPDSLIAILAAQGPLLIPAMKFKKRLMSILQIQNIDNYNFIDGKLSQFLQIKEGLNTHIISLNAPYLHITYAKKGNSKKLLTDFPEILLGNFRPYISRKIIKKESKNSKLEVSTFDNSKDPFLYLDLILSPKNCDLGNDYFQIFNNALKTVFSNSKLSMDKAQYNIALLTFTKLHTQLHETCLNSKKTIEQKARKKIRNKKSNKRVKHQKSK